MPKRKEHDPEIKKMLDKIEEHKKSIKELKQKINEIENTNKNNLITTIEKNDKFKLTFD